MMHATQDDIDFILSKYVRGEVSAIAAQLALIGHGLDAADAKARIEGASLADQFANGIEAIKTDCLARRADKLASVADVIASLQDGFEALNLIYNGQINEQWAKHLPPAMGEIKSAIRTLNRTRTPLRVVSKEGDEA